MSYITSFASQSADLNDISVPLIWKGSLSWTGVEKYQREVGTSIPPLSPLVRLFTSALSLIESPPLSEIELYDIEAGLKEIASGKLKVYKDVEESIRELRAKRKQFQREPSE